MSNFTVYKCWDFGMYFQITSSVKVVGMTSADNTLGLYPMVLGPSAVSHSYESQFVQVKVSCQNDFLVFPLIFLNNLRLLHKLKYKQWD